MRRSVRRLGLGAAVLGLLLGLGWVLFGRPGSTPPEQAPPTDSQTPRPEPSSWSARALAAAGEQGTRTLGGRVLGPEGPLAGALVVALAPPTAGWRSEVLLQERVWKGCSQGPDVSRLEESVRAHRGEGLALARATTDAQGRFLLEGLAPGAVVLWAEKGPWVGLREGGSAEPGVEADVDVHVGLGKVLSGDVRDEQRRPLAGVHVTTWVLAAGRALEALTDPEGRFSLGPLPEHDEPLLLSREGFLPQWLPPPAGRGWWSPLSLKLCVGHQIPGRVLDERGPVPGATVQPEGLPEMEAERTDEQGRFWLRELPETSSVLVARQGERVTRQWVDWSAPGEHAPVELFLAPGVRLSGWVHDPSGHALAQAEVSVYGQGGSGSTPGVKTDTQGRFLFEPLVPGRYGVIARAPLHSEQRLPPRALTSSQEVELELKPAEPVEGVVVDEGGAPVEQARLQVLDSQRQEVERAQASSGEGGHFTLEVPSPGGGWRLAIQHPGFVREEMALPAVARNLRVVLRRAASLEVEVVDEAGGPVEHAVVALSERQRGTTDARGRVVFQDLRPGPHTVLACLVDTGRLASQQQSLSAQESRTVRLVLRRSEGQLSGREVDGRGAPVEGLLLLLTPEDVQRATGCSVPREVRPDQEGRFSLEHLAEGTWTLVALGGFELEVPASRGLEPSRPARVKISPGATQLQLVLRSREQRLQGRVVREGGAPIPSFQLNGEPVDQPEGRFSLSFPEGQSRLRLDAPGFVSRSLWLSRSSEPRVDLGDVVLQAAVSLSGTVVDALSSAPLSQVRVGFESKGPQHSISPWATTRPEGHFTLEGVPAEDGTLVLLHPLYPSPQRIPVSRGAQEVVVRLAPGATLRGRVETGGVPVPEGTVQLFGPQAELSATTQIVKGSYILDSVPAGHYTVRVRGPQGAGPSLLFPMGGVELTAGESKTLDFTSHSPGTAVDVLVSSKEIDVYLIPGELPLLGPRQGLYNRLPAGFMGKRVSDEVRHFTQLPTGSYTLIAIRRDDEGTDVHRELVELPAEETLSFTLAPLWNHFED